jgi:hypothetical protein
VAPIRCLVSVVYVRSTRSCVPRSAPSLVMVDTILTRSRPEQGGGHGPENGEAEPDNRLRPAAGAGGGVTARAWLVGAGLWWGEPGVEQMGDVHVFSVGLCGVTHQDTLLTMSATASQAYRRPMDFR